MFIDKRGYSNKTNIIKGLLIASLFSAFIYLEYFEIHNKILNSILAIVSLYFILKASRKESFFIGFFIGAFWFYWVGISVQYYDLTYLAPLVILFFATGYGIIFYLFSFFEILELKVIFIYFLSYVHPLGFDWFIPELTLINSNFATSKESFALILFAIYIFIKLKKLKFIALIPLFFAISSTGIYIDNPRFKIDMPQLNVPQEQKWVKENLSNIISNNLGLIDKSILNGNDLIILPETTFPILLNKNGFLMEKLLNKSYEIDIIAGALYTENGEFYNTTYHFSKGKFEVAKKVVLVPFGEEIPLPKFFVDLINDIFYNGAKDYDKAKTPTDFIINGEKLRNAICYEATSEKIYQNLGDTRYMIAISNNAWFTPSIEPTLQKMILRYYSKKYGVTIFHSINGSLNYIVRP